ncbi:MAG: DUF3987 domain-containing protein [Phycisphaerae bacterium]|nr:DUF3987 domain-containing protein [Phycisphaerae bacterium]
MRDAAQQYLAAGLCVLPARRDQKRPTVPWKPYQTRLPTVAEVDAWFANEQTGLCVLTGQVSGNHELIDFDQGGARFAAWCENVRATRPGLLEQLVISKTQRDGRHAQYRFDGEVSGNLKLAQRRGDDGKVVTLIETRGEGGLYLCAPTPGYEVLQGDLCRLPVITAEERDILLQCAWDLNEYVPPVVDGPGGTPKDATPATRSPQGPTSGHGEPTVGLRPGDDYNQRGDVRSVLRECGWQCTRGGDNEHWRRPDKTSGSNSATFNGEHFYVFSSSAAPFEPNRAYSPFSVYTLLKHGGNWEAAARQLRTEGYGSDGPPDSDVDIAAIVGQGAPAEEVEPPNPGPPDPGPMPLEMLRVPGFISEVMDHCLATAPYPNQAMAFSGALTLVALLSGRKVRDSGDNRTNIYLLGLAHSAAGKDWPRKVNTQILHAVGMADCLGERFASGEGIQDALFLNPAMLFQTDEIDGLLQSINKARDARHEAVQSTLLTFFSISNSVFPMRRRAGRESPGVIDQPHLVIFGTAIPNHYYEALSERMLTNGFFARMIIIEAGQRGTGQEPSIRDLPPRVLDAAKWWSDFQPGEYRGNLLGIHPVPKVVEHTDEARRLMIEVRLEAEAEYATAEEKSDAVGTTVWGRVSEQTRKLALIYAVSEDHVEPRISLAAVQWASQFVMHQTRRMLFMAAGHVADNPFHAQCLRLMQRLRTAPGRQIARRDLMRAMHCKVADFDQIVSTLIQQDEIVPVNIPTRTRPAQGYRVA